MTKHDRMRRGLAFALLAGLTLAACAPRPFPTAPSRAAQEDLTRELAAGPAAAAWARPGARLVAICYGGALNPPEEVRAEAQLACPAGTLTLLDTDLIWNRCPLLQPAKASYVCTPDKTERAQD
jgi:hypothetical protein